MQLQIAASSGDQDTYNFYNSHMSRLQKEYQIVGRLSQSDFGSKKEYLSLFNPSVIIPY